MAPTRPTRAAFVLLVAACSRSAPPTRAPDEPAPVAVRAPESSISPGDFVVVRSGEGLYASAGASTPVATTDRSRLQGVLRVLTVSGQWVELLNEKRYHCISSLAPEWADVRLFVPVSALARVTRREFSVEYQDGTRVRLSAGLPVGDKAIHLWLTDGWIVELPVELPESAIGLSYAEHEPMVVSGPDGGHIGRTIEATLGGKGFELPVDAELLGGTPTSGRSLVGIVGRCVDASILVTESDVVPAAARSTVTRRERGFVSSLDDGAAERLYTIAAGTEIRWPSGASAGTVVATALLDVDPDRVRDVLCWRPPGALWGEDARFCFDPSAVEEHSQNLDVEE